MKLNSRSVVRKSLILAGVSLACFAVSQVVFPQMVTVFRGKHVSGNLSSLFESDNNRLVVTGGPTMNAYEAPLDVRIETVCSTGSPQRLVMTYETKANSPGLTQYVDMWEWNSNTWVTVDQRTVPLTDTLVNVEIPLCWRFTNPNTSAMRMRFWVGNHGPVVIPNWAISIDQMIWDVDPQ